MISLTFAMGSSIMGAKYVLINSAGK
jgi:hypothetical protein